MSADWVTRCVTPVVSADELRRQYYDTDRGLSAEDMLALQRGNVTALIPQLAN